MLSRGLPRKRQKSNPLKRSRRIAKTVEMLFERLNLRGKQPFLEKATANSRMQSWLKYMAQIGG
jgi:hypothetical protein